MSELTHIARHWLRSAGPILLILLLNLWPTHGRALQVGPPRLPVPEEEVAKALGSVLGDYYNYRRDLPPGPRYPCFGALGQDCFGGDIDGGCNAARQCRSEEEMAAFADRLAGLVEEYPGSPLPLSHAVYAAVKPGFLDLASSLMEGCASGGEWWCDLAAGYTHHRSGRTTESDSHFRRALGAMPDSLQCSLENIESLLPEDVRQEYAQLPCDGRSDVHRWFWWSADPFLVDEGNDRWAEHLSRGFEEMLNLDLNDRVRSGVGGHPRGCSIRRGFPDSRDVYSRSTGNRVAVTVVLWRSRGGAFNHFVPEALALQGLADDLHYRLEAEVDVHPLVNGTGDEGYTRAAGFVMPVPVQIARFREGASMDLALGSELGSVGIGTSGEAFFVASEDPEHVVALEPAPLREKVVFKARLANRKQLVGIEVFTPGPDGRHRQVLLPLDPSERLVSDILLFRPLGPNLPETRLGAVALMHGSQRVSRDRELGVYWEAYGFLVEEELGISVRLQSVEGGWVSRALRVIGIGGEGRSTLSWTETVMESGPFPNVITVDIGAVDPGQYDLVIEVAAEDGTRLIRRRRLEVVEAPYPDRL